MVLAIFALLLIEDSKKLVTIIFYKINMGFVEELLPPYFLSAMKSRQDNFYNTRRFSPRNLPGSQTVALAKVSDPESGYTRKYIVVRQHDGEEPEVLTEGIDFYIKDGVLYVISDRFSTFAVAYQDTMIPAYGGVEISNVEYSVARAPETGENTTQSADVSSNAATMIVATIAALTMGGVVILAKHK